MVSHARKSFLSRSHVFFGSHYVGTLTSMCNIFFLYVFFVFLNSSFRRKEEKMKKKKTRRKSVYLTSEIKVTKTVNEHKHRHLLVFVETQQTYWGEKPVGNLWKTCRRRVNIARTYVHTYANSPCIHQYNMESTSTYTQTPACTHSHVYIYIRTHKWGSKKSLCVCMRIRCR